MYKLDLETLTEERLQKAVDAETYRIGEGLFKRDAVHISEVGDFSAQAAVLDVFDAAGRRIASVPPTVGGNSVAWSWNGSDRAGRMVRGEVVFARARDGRGGAVRVVVTR